MKSLVAIAHFSNFLTVLAVLVAIRKRWTVLSLALTSPWLLEISQVASAVTISFAIGEHPALDRVPALVSAYTPIFVACLSVALTLFALARRPRRLRRPAVRAGQGQAAVAGVKLYPTHSPNRHRTRCRHSSLGGT